VEKEVNMVKNNKIKKACTDVKKRIFKSKNKFTIVEVISFMVITFALGLIAGGVIMYGKGKYSGNVNESLNEFIDTYNDILSNYYEPVDGDQLLEAGINGMVSFLGDPYSTYYNAEATEEFNETLDGEYSGIGAEIQLVDKKVMIITIFKDSPAEKAGLKVGDQLVKADGKELDTTNLSNVTKLVKGKSGTDVVLTIIRDGEEKKVTVTRGVVAIQSVESEIINEGGKKVGYLEVSIFAENTDSQFEKALKELEKEKIDALVVDLRGNSGGHLKTVTNMISLFTKKGEVIYQLKTREEVKAYKDETEESRNYKVVILIDCNSASASEVFTAALKERYHATVVGTTSFGKGKVQKSYQLSSGAMIKYTYQEWLTPEGNYIDGIGITPDVLVEYKEENGRDTQFNSAIKEAVK
jgi:carboxyl-terminal processing protease